MLQVNILYTWINTQHYL